VILLNKPFGVICQFSASGPRPTLAGFVRVPRVYPAGRLDTDSEGLVVLTDSGPLQTRISDPRGKLAKTYWVQVEGDVSDEALGSLSRGVLLNDGPTLPAGARRIEPPLPERDPPIRFRKAIPTSWMELVLVEGRNRQVRRMTAAVGLPTLRLYRACVGPWSTEGLDPGQWREASAADLDGNAPRNPVSPL
jgi:23S rRNA pseudouridine2457 synthase